MTELETLKEKSLAAVSKLMTETVRANDRAAYLSKHLKEQHNCNCEGMSLIVFLQYMEDERKRNSERRIDAAHVAVNAIVSCSHLEAGACEECIREAIESRGTLKR